MEWFLWFAVSVVAATVFYLVFRFFVRSVKASVKGRREYEARIQKSLSNLGVARDNLARKTAEVDAKALVVLNKYRSKDSVKDILNDLSWATSVEGKALLGSYKVSWQWRLYTPGGQLWEGSESCRKWLDSMNGGSSRRSRRRRRSSGSDYSYGSSGYGSGYPFYTQGHYNGYDGS